MKQECYFGICDITAVDCARYRGVRPVYHKALTRCACVCCIGVERQLPDGYTGLVLKPCGPTATAAADTAQRSWQAARSFERLTLWNHDLTPTAADWHNRCIDWLTLADQVCTSLCWALGAGRAADHPFESIAAAALDLATCSAQQLVLHAVILAAMRRAPAYPQSVCVHWHTVMIKVCPTYCAIRTIQQLHQNDICCCRVGSAVNRYMLQSC